MKKNIWVMVVIAIAIVIAILPHSKKHIGTIAPAPKKIVVPAKMQESKDFELLPRVVMFI